MADASAPSAPGGATNDSNFDPASIGATAVTSPAPSDNGNPTDTSTGFDPASLGATPVTAKPVSSTPAPTFGGPSWLGSKQMSAIDFTNQSAIKQYAQAAASTIPDDFETIINSAGNLAKGLGSATVNAFNPDMSKNTIANTSKAIAGGVQEIPGISDLYNKYSQGGADNPTLQSNRQQFNNIVSYFGKRYGGKNLGDVAKNVANTAGTDPVGTLFDLSMLLDAAGGGTKAISQLGQAGDISELTKGMSDADKMAFVQDASRSGAFGKGMEVGQKLNDVGEALNPVTNVVKAGADALKGAKDLFNQKATPVLDEMAQKDWEKPGKQSKPGYADAKEILKNAKDNGNSLGERLQQNGIKLSDNITGKNYDTADAAEQLRKNTIKASNETLRPALKDADPGVERTPVKDILQKAKSNIDANGDITAERKITLKNNIDKIQGALESKYPNGMGLEDLHNEKILRDSNVKYDTVTNNPATNDEALKNKAIADASRKTLEQKFPLSKSVNAEFQKNFQAADYLDAINGKAVPQSTLGRITRGAVQGGAAMLGSNLGIGGAFGGYTLGGVLENMLRNAPTTLRDSMLGGLQSENPEAFSNLSDYMKQSAADRASRLALPAGDSSKVAIPLGSPQGLRVPPELKGTPVEGPKPTFGDTYDVNSARDKVPVLPPTHNFIEAPKELPSLKDIHDGYNRLYNTYVKHFRGNGT